jgi:phytoene dehydrogenase-like protein
MNEGLLPRREFLKVLASAYPAVALDWKALPSASSQPAKDGTYDCIVIGSGLAGLACAAAFARQGFRPLVLEQHDRPGGFATAFRRPGGFLFDVSLHSTTVGERNGVRNLIGGFPEITGVEFLPHPNLFRAIFPEHDIRVAQRDPDSFVKMLTGLFPDEREGIAGLFDDMRGLSRDVQRLSGVRGQPDMSRFPLDFPHLYKFYNKTWGEMAGTRIKDARLKAILSAQWGYYGLPPSKLSCFYYVLPFMGYLSGGGYYPRGRSQDISDALAAFIRSHGGTVLLKTKVDRITVAGGRASGVVTTRGTAYTSRVVVSNADPFQTLGRMVSDEAAVAEYRARWPQWSVSLSCFQVFLGLKEDLIGRLRITDSEVFIEPSYDPDGGYAIAQNADVERGGVGAMLYDNIYRGYSPAGKNTINLMVLQGYGPWEKFENAYLAGNKAAYRKEKERMADVLIQKAEKALLPGLTRAVEVREAATPLTVVRYTGHHRGAIYGWDQTVNNSGSARVGHATPIKDLYLAGAWSRPGHGYGAVIPSGLECFAEIVKGW